MILKLNINFKMLNIRGEFEDNKTVPFNVLQRKKLKITMKIGII